jgi:hypothetical protein
MSYGWVLVPQDGRGIDGKKIADSAPANKEIGDGIAGHNSLITQAFFRLF